MFRFFANFADPFAPYDAAQPPRSVAAYILTHIKPFRLILLGGFASSVFGAIIDLLLVYYAGRLVDALSSIQPSEVWSQMGGELVLAAVTLLIVRPLNTAFGEGTDDIAYRPNAVSLMRWRAHRHLLRQPVGWFRNEQSGRLASRVRELSIAGTGVAYSIVHTLVYAASYMIGAFILMLSVDVRLIWPLGAWAIFYIAHVAYAVPRFRDTTEEFQNALSNLTSLFVDTYSNIDIIKLFADKSNEDREAEKRFHATRDTFVEVQNIEVFINTGMVILSNFLLVGLTGYAIYLWSIGDAQLGLVASALALSMRMSSLSDWIMDAVSSIFGWYGATREALKSVSQPLALTDRPDARPLALSGGAISFKNVSHAYEGENAALNNVSIDIAAGEKIGIVGHSGAGKSTLVNLLLRSFDPDSGDILIDGQKISSVTQDSLRHQISMVAQDSSLLNRSIAENIAYGLGEADRLAINSAAQKAEAAGFIGGLVDSRGNRGYDAIVGERGVKLSGGQRQRIALARALMKDAPILILDEATSALDSAVEASILKTLYEMMDNKTVIAIAHRLSTIARMDRIIVLDQGRVAESGTHEELLAENGIYADLWARQSDGFIGD